MTRIKIHISNVKLPFYPPCEVKCGLQNMVSTFPWLIYFKFIACYVHEPVGCHSCHVGPLGLLPLSLGFHSPFTLLLPIVVLMGLLAVILVMLDHWANYLFPLLFPFIFPYCWSSSVVGPFFKKKWASTLLNIHFSYTPWDKNRNWEYCT